MEENKEEQMSDEEALMKLAMAMKDNVTASDEKQNTHTFLNNVVLAPDNTKIGNLQVDDKINELGIPFNTVRGLKEMALISLKIMDNTFFNEYFEKEAQDTLATSLSREGFLIRQATTTTKQVADATRRRTVNKGMFGSRKVEEQGGDLTTSRFNQG